MPDEDPGAFLKSTEEPSAAMYVELEKDEAELYCCFARFGRSD